MTTYFHVAFKLKPIFKTSRKMSTITEYTFEANECNKTKDLLAVMHDKVYDVTKLFHEHPRADQVCKEVVGTKVLSLDENGHSELPTDKKMNRLLDDIDDKEKTDPSKDEALKCDNNFPSRLSLNEIIGFKRQEPGFAAKAIHAGQKPELWNCKSVVLPIYMSVTYVREDLEPSSELKYYDSPTRTVLEKTLAAIDNAKYALSFPSGTGGQTALIATLSAGDGIICGDNIYTGTIGLFRDIAANVGIETQFVDLTKLDHLKKALKSNTKIVWMETPTNPMMIVLDIRAIAEIVHKESNAILVVDNTPLSSYFQRPLDLGVDAVAYSLTKFMNGHNDVIMGSITTNSQELYEKLKMAQNLTGIVPSSFDCYMVFRSMKTLAIRMERHSENALLIARYLETHPRVSNVLHPGLPSHPQHKLALSQSYGHSGSFCFYIKDGTLDMTKKFLKSLHVFMWADSLGGCESLAQAPLLWFAVPTTFSDEEVKELGLAENLIRLSCGLEDLQFLIEDLNQALNGL